MPFNMRHIIVSRRLASLALSVAILGLCLSGALFGQTLGEITGEVRDSTGGVITGAEIQVTNTGTGAQRRTMSNASGVYSFPLLQPGTYDVSVSMTGFQSMTRSSLELQVQETARVDFTLQVGQSS